MATVILFVAVVSYRAYLSNPAETPRTVAYRTLALEIRERFPSASTSALELGTIGYYNKARTYDLTGLTNKEPEFLTTSNLDRFFEIKPHIVILFDPVNRMEENLFHDARFSREYRLAGGLQGFQYYEAVMPK